MKAAGLKLPRKAHTFTPVQSDNYEELFRFHARAAVARYRTKHGIEWPKDASYRVEMQIRRNDVLVRIEALSQRERLHDCDVDNVGKQIDAMNHGVAWGDDRQVFDMRVFESE